MVIENGCEKTNAIVELIFANGNNMVFNVSPENLTPFESNRVKLKNERMRLRSHLHPFLQDRKMKVDYRKKSIGMKAIDSTAA